MTQNSLFTKNLPFSPACERNKEVILRTISSYLNRAECVLEIGTGTAQHAVHFANFSPNLTWQTSDLEQYHDGIIAQLKHANVSNIKPPLILDVNQPVWVSEKKQFDLVFTANTLHIMSKADVRAFFNGLSAVTSMDACLIVYGPFKYQGHFTSESNQQFDQSLRSRQCGSAIRDFEWVNELANAQGFGLLVDHDMPVNNQCLIWQKKAPL